MTGQTPEGVPSGRSVRSGVPFEVVEEAYQEWKSDWDAGREREVGWYIDRAVAAWKREQPDAKA